MFNNQQLKNMMAWLICTLFFMYEFLLRTIMGTLQSNIMTDFHLNPIEFSILSTTSYQCIYGLMQISVGVVIERFGLKRSLIAAIILCCGTTWGFAMTNHYHLAFLFRLLMGLGSSFGFICLLMTIYDRMPRKYIAVCIGISQFMGTLGPMLAAGPLCDFAEATAYNWREIFYILGAFSALLAILAFVCIDKNRPASSELIILARPIGMLEKLWKILKNQQLWYIVLFSGGCYFAL